MIQEDNKPKIGIIGSGFIAKGLLNLILQKNELEISNVLTRSKIQDRKDISDYKILTNSIKELMDNSDIIVECTGDVEYTADNMLKISQSNIPVVTMNTEFHVTLGSYFVDKMFITEGEGDQPGCLAALDEEVKMMGFTPLVYGNIKRFLNENPTKEDMQFWAHKSKVSLAMVTSFTDGTKVQMEQAFVANGLGSTILQQGLTGVDNSNISEIGSLLAENAKRIQNPISDYIISTKGPAGVFITATHEENQGDALSYYKMGKGPFYTLVKEYHLPHLELYKTILRVLYNGKVLLNNSLNPTISVASITKRDLKAGEKIDKAIGSFDIRGEAIKIDNHLDHVPIGLLNNVILKRDIEIGEMLQLSDIELKNEKVYKMWLNILQKK